MQYEIEEITQSNKQYHNVPNESFEVFGKLDVSFNNNTWSYEERLFEHPSIKAYEREKIDLEKYIASEDQVVFFAVSGKDVLGQIVIRKKWNKFCFIDDIAVSSSARQKGVASSLINRAQIWAAEKNLKGFMLETQDVNLAACKLYIKNEFILGSVDTMLYNNLECKDEKALLWYKKFSE